MTLKNLGLLSVLFTASLFLIGCSSDKNVQVNVNMADTAPSAAEGFNLEYFHKLLIEEAESEEQWNAQFLSDLVNRPDVNNLDLNQNGTVDTILVEPFNKDGIRGFQLYTKVVNRPGMAQDEEQTICTISVEQEGDKGNLTVSGNEQVYGQHHHYHSSGLSNFFLMYWLMSPRMMYGPAYARSYTPRNNVRQRASNSNFKNRQRIRNVNHKGTQAPKATRPTNVKSPVAQKTAATGIKSKLKNPTSSQRAFRKQATASRSKSAFGRKSTGTRAKSSSGRTRMRGGK